MSAIFRLNSGDCSMSQSEKPLRISSILLLASRVTSGSRIFISLPVLSKTVLVMLGVVLWMAWRMRAMPLKMRLSERTEYWFMMRGEIMSALMLYSSLLAV